MHRNRIALLTLIAAPPLALAACSSSSSGGHAVDLPGGTHTTVSAPVNSARPGGGSTSHAAAGGGSGNWCQELTDAGQSILALGGTSVASPSEFKAKLDALVNDAPAEIKPDVQVLAQVDEKIVDGDTTAENALSDPSVAAKIQHFVSWLTTNCPGVLDGVPSGLPTG
jgi:hypothetical protein